MDKEGKKMKIITAKKITVLSVLILCVFLSGCGCGKKKKRSGSRAGSEDQYHTGTVSYSEAGRSKSGCCSDKWKYHNGK